jgi:pimeloyl-ACP methyl ester carboxylesterase
MPSPTPPARVTRVPHDGLLLDVRDEGPVDGDPVVLLHGFPQGPEAWDRLLPALHDAGFRTLVPTMRGYGEQARPGAVSAYRTRALVDDVLAVLDAASVTRAHVVGHDWGGLLAWALAADAPARVASLAVVSTPHPAALQSAWRDQLRRSWYLAAFQLPWLPERLLAPDGRLWSWVARGLPDDLALAYTARIRDEQTRHAMLQWYRAMPLEVRRPSVRIGRIDVPTLYVWGARDPALGPVAAKATERYVRGPYRLEVLERAGHWIPERHPDQLAAALLPHLRQYPVAGPDVDSPGGAARGGE